MSELIATAGLLLFVGCAVATNSPFVALGAWAAIMALVVGVAGLAILAGRVRRALLSGTVPRASLDARRIDWLLRDLPDPRTVIDIDRAEADADRITVGGMEALTPAVRRYLSDFNLTAEAFIAETQAPDLSPQERWYRDGGNGAQEVVKYRYIGADGEECVEYVAV